MAVQKKKKPKKQTPENPNKLEVFTWTPKRKQAALLLSKGTKNYEEVAEEVRIHISTLWLWRQNNDFLEEVDRLTLKNELATKAGLLRLAYQAVDKKKGTDLKNLENDKTTVLDWAEFIVKIIPDETKDDEDKLNALAEAIKQSARAVGK